MARGGKRTGAGRPKNAANRFSEQARAMAAAEGITPLEFFLSVLRDPELDRATRMDAGKAAAPYMHARLESIKHSGDPDNPVHIKSETDAKFRAVASALDELAGAGTGGTSGAGELVEEIPPEPKDPKG